MELAERLAFLTSFFACSSEDAKALNEAMSIVEYRAKEVLTHQGDLGAKVWIVLDGLAQLQVIGSDGQIQLLAAHGPGELFGALPEERIAVSDIVAHSRLSALETPTQKFMALIEANRGVATGLTRILARQYNAVLDRMAARITLTAIGRVYSELLNIAGDHNIISPPPVVAALGLKAQTTRETASRAINALVRRGIVSRDAQQLKINSRTLLEDLIV
jgi:CRP/FNR family cyclic AMP-dependent transcriptional regulator